MCCVWYSYQTETKFPFIKKPKKRLSILLNYDSVQIQSWYKGSFKKYVDQSFTIYPTTLFLPVQAWTFYWPSTYLGIAILHLLIHVVIECPQPHFFPIWNIKYQGANWGSIDSFYFKFSRMCTHQIYFNLNHLNLQYIKSGNYSLLFAYIFQKVDFHNCVIGGFIE